VAVAFRAGSGGSNNAATTSLVPTLPTGTAVGDLTLIYVQCTNADVAYGAATGGWVKLAEHSNFLFTNLAGAIYGRVWTATPAAPTITFADGSNAGGAISWSAVSFLPGAGGTLDFDNVADPGKFTASGTSFAVNSRTAAASSVCSVIFSGQRSNTTGTATIASTTPTNWTQPTGVSKSTTFTATTAGNEQLGTNIFYRLAQSGAVAPGNVTINRDASSSIWHLLIVETLPTTNLTSLADATGTGTLTATTVPGGSRTAAFTGTGTLGLTQSKPAVTTTAGPSGSGVLSATTTARVSQSAALAGSGTLSGNAVAVSTASAALTGSGTLTGAQVPKPVTPAAFTGSGTLAATAASGVVAFYTGSGTLAAAQARLTVTTTPALSGSGALTAVRTPVIPSTAAMTGSGTLAASPTTVRRADLSGSGALAATTSRAMQRALLYEIVSGAWSPVTVTRL
jgi:hypothetical protein